MKAIRLQRFGGPEELRLEDLAPPVAGEGEVVIEVHAAGLNYADLVLREGRVPGAPTPPFTPGYEAAGVITSVGGGVTHLKRGDRVAVVLPGQGAFAEQVCAPALLVTPLPDALSFEHAVALLTQAPTALLALRSAARLQPGDTVFVPSAAGGVGSFLVQLAKHLGARRVIAAAGTEARRALARRLGADAVVDATQADWPERLREATEGRGADVVFVREGGEVFEQSLRALAPHGRLVVFGIESILGAEVSRARLAQVVFSNQALVGFSTMTLPADVQAAALREALELATKGRLQVVVGQTFPLGALDEAHRALAERKTTGKVVIHPRAPSGAR